LSIGCWPVCVIKPTRKPWFPVFSNKNDFHIGFVFVIYAIDEDTYFLMLFEIKKVVRLVWLFVVFQTYQRHIDF